MPRIAIQPEWTAQYEMDRDGDVKLGQIECDGEALAWDVVPECIDRMLCAAARAAEAERMREAAGVEVDARLLERKEAKP
jgi:hypothetical protein